MATTISSSLCGSEQNVQLNDLKVVKNMSTQYNYYVMKKNNMKSKSVSCNIKAGVEFQEVKVKEQAKPLQITVSRKDKATQCCTLPITVPPKKSTDIQKTKTTEKSTGTSVITKCKWSQTKPALGQEFLGGVSKLINSDYPEELNCLVSEDRQNELFLRITRKRAAGILYPGSGLNPIELTVWESGKCHLYVLFKAVEVFQLQKVNKENEGIPKENGTNESINNESGSNEIKIVQLEAGEDLKKLLDTISGRLGHAFCPGVNETKVINENENANFVLHKRLKTILYPYRRYQAVQCQIYHQYYLKKFPKDPKSKQCKFCAALTNEITKGKKRKADETPTRKFKRQRITSNYPIHLLTPKSKKYRLSKIKQSRFQMRRKISKLEKELEVRDLEVSDPFSKEMSEIVQRINQQFPDELEKTFDSTDGFTKELLKKSWERDSNVKHFQDQRDFLADQANSFKTLKKRKWNAITLRVALAVYCRSPAAYKALRGFNILNLPGEGTLKEKTRKLNLKPGVQEEFLAEEKLKYSSFKEEKELLGELVPKGDGILVMDEVKVIDKIMWNSKSHEFVGYSMNEDDYSELTDIYKASTPTSPSPTQYILQFLWRDMTSGYDLIGPYFTSAYPFQQKSLVTCLYATIEALHTFGFKTMGIICDGASENLALMKVTMGISGSFGFVFKNGNYNFEIQPSFENPFSEDSQKIHWIICPSHQLKNVIGQLFASRDNGPKDFSRNKIHFGWHQLEEVRARDKERMKVGQLRRARHLEDSYLVRDAWTKLNVAPSKVMQQEDVLCELYEYTAGEKGSKESREKAMETYKFLRACNQLFENGFLTSRRIDSETSEVMESILKGYKYFEDWIKEILLENPEYNFNSPRQAKFLSWQTWDLLRVAVFGLKNLANDFFKRYPGHFLAPVRINGSSIESLFAQIKYATGGKVTSLNYVSGLKATLIRRNVHGSHRGNKDYRDQMLCFREYSL